MRSRRAVWKRGGVLGVLLSAAAALGAGGLEGCGGHGGGAAPAGASSSGPAAPEFVSSPAIAANAAVPLAPSLAFETSTPTSVVVQIADGARTFTASFAALATAHEHPLLGLRAGRAHTFTIVARDAGGAQVTATSAFTTAPLPADFPPITLVTRTAGAIEPGVTLMSAFPRGASVPGGATNYLVAVDDEGEVVWYYGRPDYMGDARRTSAGTLIYGDRELAVVEIDMAGRELRRWFASAIHAPPAGAIPVAVDSLHHECYEMTSGHLLALSSELRHFAAWPASETTPGVTAPADVIGDVIVEFDAAGAVTGSWSALDLLDPTRLGYNSLQNFWNVHYAPVISGTTRDWSHGNAVVHDPTDDSIIVSLRHQDAVVKLRRATGEIVWILGPHEGWTAPWSSKLLAPQGGMEWQYHQHAAKVLPSGHILLFDNGTYRASPPAPKLPAPQNYSRAVELEVDEAAMTVREVWRYGGPGQETFYSPFICDADLLPTTGNVLVTDGGRVVDDGGVPSDDLSAGHRFARVVEVTHAMPPAKVWEVAVGDPSPATANGKGWLVYRSSRLASLYPPPALAFASAPAVATASAAPLAATVAFTTSAPTWVFLEVTDGARTFTARFPSFEAAHEVPVLGLRPGRTYSIAVTATDATGRAVRSTLAHATAPLPSDFPPITVVTRTAALMEPGVTLFPAASPTLGANYLVMIDGEGEVVWYRRGAMTDVRRLPGGTIVFNEGDDDMIEIDMLGRTLRRWAPTAIRPGAAGEIAVAVDAFHHDVAITPSGTGLALSSEVRTYTAYPTSLTDPLAPSATARVAGDVVVEFDAASGAVLRSWSLLDLLDPYRLGYGSLGTGLGALYPGAPVFDWSHSNALVLDEATDSYVVSVRHQDAVVKIRRETGEVVWILGPHDNWRAPWSAKLLTPLAGLEWQFHQHSAKVLPDGHILMYDNGDFRACPPAARLAATLNSSRAVEFAVDEGAMTVEQVWSYGGPSDEVFYSPYICDADLMPVTGNVFITDGGRLVDASGDATDGSPMDPANHNFARLLEVTHDTPATKVFEVLIGDEAPGTPSWRVYRSQRLAGVYP